MLRRQRAPAAAPGPASEPASPGRLTSGSNEERQASLRASGELAPAPAGDMALAEWMAFEEEPEPASVDAGSDLAMGGGGGDPGIFGGIDAFGGLSDWIGVPGYANLGTGGGELGLAAELARATLWANAGPYGPIDQVGAGGLGGFSATYHPKGGPGELMVTQDVALDLQDTMVLAGGVVVPNPTLPSSPDLRNAAATLNALPAEERAAALRNFQWDPSERTNDGPWASKLEDVVEQTWGGQHEFFLNRPGWDFIGSQVAIDLALHMRPRIASDHMHVVSYKLEPHTTLGNYNDEKGERIPNGVDSRDKTNARDQWMRLGSDTVDPVEYGLLTKNVLFEAGSATLTQSTATTLQKFATRFNGAQYDPRHQDIDIALVLSTGADTELAERRAANVLSYLDANGFHDPEERIRTELRQVAEGQPVSDRGELVVDGGGRQVVAAHEWGHAFGLDDEYGTSVGTPVAHDQWVKDMTDAGGNPLPGAIQEHNGGVMSYGNEVRPQHYAAFHHALGAVTGQRPWSLGAPNPYLNVAAKAVPSERVTPGRAPPGVAGWAETPLASGESPMTGGEWGGWAETPMSGGDTDMGWPEINWG